MANYNNPHALAKLKARWLDVMAKQEFILNEVNTKNEKDDLWDRIVTADPTKTKAYLPWVATKGLSEWHNKAICLFMEDIPSIRDTLTDYHALKKKGHLPINLRDINTFNSIESVWVTTQEYTKAAIDNLGVDAQRFFDMNQATLHHNDAEYYVVIPHTDEASCHFGRHTKWCTAAIKSDNHFERYYENGYLYIITHKPSKKKWQFQLGEGGLVDAADRMVEAEDFIHTHPRVFSEIINFTEETKIEAVNKCPYVIQFIENPSEELKLYAVQRGGRAIEYIKDPSENIQWEAVKQNGAAIQFIKNPSREMQREAVKQNGWAIKFIKNATEEMKLEAVKQSGAVIQFIKNPSKQVCMEAVKRHPLNIEYILQPSEKLKMLAVKQDGSAIRFITFPSEEIQLEAVKQYGSMIMYMDEPSEAVQLAAIEQNPYNIKHIKNPSEKIQLAAFGCVVF